VLGREPLVRAVRWEPLVLGRDPSTILPLRVAGRWRRLPSGITFRMGSPRICMNSGAARDVTDHCLPPSGPTGGFFMPPVLAADLDGNVFYVLASTNQSGGLSSSSFSKRCLSEFFTGTNHRGALLEVREGYSLWWYFFVNRVIFSSGGS